MLCNCHPLHLLVVFAFRSCESAHGHGLVSFSNRSWAMSFRITQRFGYLVRITCHWHPCTSFVSGVGKELEGALRQPSLRARRYYCKVLLSGCLASHRTFLPPQADALSHSFKMSPCRCSTVNPYYLHPWDLEPSLVALWGPLLQVCCIQLQQLRVHKFRAFMHGSFG